MEYGILSILPPLIAILLAIRSKQVFISLFAGIFAAELIMVSWHPLSALNNSLNGIVAVFAEGWITKTIIFSFLVGAIITLIQASGGVAGFIDYLTKKTKTVKSKRGAMMLSFIIGIVIFIESSITILVSGVVARPLTDKYKVSREKLAFICDSTSAPICALIPLNGWGATLIAILGVQVSAGVISGNPVQILIKSLPFQFYSIIAVISVFYYIWTGKDWGPMKKAEERVMTTGQVLREGATPLVSTDATDVPVKEGVTPNMMNMILPLIVLIAMMPIGLYVTGEGNMMEGSGSTSVFWAVLASLAFCGVYFIAKKIMNLHEYMDYFYKGVGGMVPVASLLIFAFAIGNSISNLGTGKYMASIVEGRINGALGPAIIFILGCIIAFSTGTSWGTFAILMPIAMQMAVAMDANIYASAGAVISGAIMGDHCSPISDTTILASMASASDHIDHVKTQIPYALVSAAIAFVLYVIVGFVG
ncbi:Na+/H+ antiporter NhaC family protein [Tepidibacter aestuarii]|uniref:Na+/H+ antiporter NhaC family protein n=1 Tax=Tepidibacter aestuarii TaxID=2925782 RepID=UPI0020BE9CBE|nr:Na+/H+ antiporter NhaC family protein [Tepidibacter aestuarii]CAH2213810.1 tetracycline resistance efflux pump [Tepidibacter aestuarii]